MPLSRPGKFGKSGIFGPSLGKFGNFMIMVNRSFAEGAFREKERKKENTEKKARKKLGGQMMDKNSNKANTKFIYLSAVIIVVGCCCFPSFFLQTRLLIVTGSRYSPLLPTNI